MMAMPLSGVPVVVVLAGGIPVINSQTGPAMTVGANLLGTAITIVTENGIPVSLLKDDGTAYP